LFIAEIGINHNGNLEYAYDLIDMAYKAGIDYLNRVDDWLGNKKIKVYKSEEKIKKKLRR
jgi:hypothetical protein